MKIKHVCAHVNLNCRAFSTAIVGSFDIRYNHEKRCPAYLLNFLKDNPTDLDEV